MSFKDKIDTKKLPQHVAVIMDGNGRWARKQGRLRTFGHKHGVEAVRDTVTASAELGIKYLTLYAFSTENWNRPKLEVDALMNLLVSTLGKELKTLTKNKIRLLAIGDLENLPKKCYNELQETIDKTKNNDRMTLILSLSYSSRWELTRMTKLIATEVKNGQLNIDQINQELISNYLTTKEIPDPELLIRTSNELRVSNFLLWQIAYSELYFTETLWPDFRRDHLYEAIVEFQKRERRFGKVISHES
ncbi:MAG TPA: isoprenyl transferase [Bacteroidia bacterium]|nr:isoprenyl transferase [Bacteroidia bacterium]HNT79264.1 isoprenyl transferase [Bacteroidia bacterium]